MEGASERAREARKSMIAKGRGAAGAAEVTAAAAAVAFMLFNQGRRL